MLHQPAKNFVPAPSFPALSIASPDEVKRARAWIAGARKCGLSVFPWKGSADNGGVMQFGQDMEGPNDFGAASKRFLRHPAADLDRTLPRGLVYELLCQDFGVDPETPYQELCDQVNVRLAAEGEARATMLTERKLLKLCRSAPAILREDERLEIAFSQATDAFAKVEKPKRPRDGMLPPSFWDMSYGEARHELREARKTPLDKLDYWKIAALATGRFKAFVDDLKVFEAQMRALREEHGYAAARKASDAANRRSRAVVADIAAIPATSPAGLAAKCQVMKTCLDTGWELQDIFEKLATSIFDDGALCGEMLLPTYRPPGSVPTEHVQH